MHNQSSSEQANTVQSGKSFTPNTIELYFSEFTQKHTIICSRCSKATCGGDIFCCDSARNMYAQYFMFGKYRGAVQAILSAHESTTRLTTDDYTDIADVDSNCGKCGWTGKFDDFKQHYCPINSAKPIIHNNFGLTHHG